MAKTISDMMEFGKYSLKDAANEMVMKRLPALGGDGGLIAVDHQGHVSMPFQQLYFRMVLVGKFCIPVSPALFPVRSQEVSPSAQHISAHVLNNNSDVIRGFVWSKIEILLF